MRTASTFLFFRSLLRPPAAGFHGGGLPPGFPPLDPTVAQRAAQELQRAAPWQFQPPSTRGGGLPQGSGTPTPAEAARAYENLASEWHQAQMDLAQAFTPEQRVAAQRRLEDVRVGFDKLAEHASRAPWLGKGFEDQWKGLAQQTRAQATQQQQQFLDDLQQTGQTLDPERDDVDRIAAAARTGDAKAMEAWQKATGTAEALGQEKKLKRFAEAEKLAGENPERAKQLLDKLPFANTAAERDKILKELDDAGGVTHKRTPDKAKVDAALLRYAESAKTDALSVQERAAVLGIDLKTATAQQKGMLSQDIDAG